MRLERLELTAYGKFAGEALEFGPTTAGLHLVYGDNEAGKSTALRAIRSALFGVPVQTGDTFLHAAKDVRIGLEVSAGSERLAFVRRKGRANTLLSPSGEVLNEAALGRFLGSVDQTLFDSMFGLNHESLRQGAQALLALEGKLGETLFEAGFGTAHLRSLLQSFRDEAEEIFTARGRSKRLNVEIARVRKAKELVTQSATSPQAYLELRRQLEMHQASLSEVNEAKQRLTLDKAEIELRLRLLPLVAQWRAYGEQRATLGELPELPLDAEQQAQAAVRRAETATAQRDHAAREVTRVLGELERIVVDDALVTVPGGKIDELAERLGGARKANIDLPKRRAELAAVTDEIKRLLVALGYAADPRRVEEYRLTRDEETQVRRLIRERTQYDTKVSDMNGKLKQLEVSVAALKKELAKAPEETNVRSLESALVRAQKYADLELQLDRAKLQLDSTERQLNERVEELRGALVPPWNTATTTFGSEDLWGGATAVTAALVGELSLKLDGARRQVDAFRAETFTLSERALELSHRVTAMEQDSAVPTERGLAELQAARDALLNELEARTGEAVGEPSKKSKSAANKSGSHAEGATARDGWGELRQRIHSCDDYGARLRREADRVAEFRTRRLALSEVTERLALRQERERVLTAELEALELQWTSLWRGTAFSVGSPSEMAGVLARVAELRALEGTRNEAVGQLRKLERELATVVAELSQEMVQVGEPGRMLWESLGQFVNRLEATLNDKRQQNERRRELGRRLARETELLEQLQRDATELKEAGRSVRNEWPKVTKRLGVNKDAGPEELDGALNGLAELFRRVDDAQSLERRIAGIMRDAEALEGEVRSLSHHIRSEVNLDNVLDVLERLVGEYRRQVACAGERARLRTELAERRRTVERATFEMEQAHAALQRLFQVARVADVDEMFRVIAKVNRATELERLRAEEERRIIAHGEGRGLGELVALCDGQQSAALQAQRTRLQDELSGHEARWVELTKLTVAAEQRLNQLGEGAARAAEELESEVAALQATLRRYLRLRVATVVLETEIERYRDANQGPVLSRARELFPQLTLGRYGGLSVGFDSDDQPILLCTTADGREVPVEGLSDGTRDQLYLSLRLATLQQYFRTNAPMPWVLDDVLVHFDDDRAQAALEVLAEFSKHTQVLFFTHHARTVELARRHLPAERVAFHQLGRMPASA